ncbi:Stk1 family PASTA domain-containing Ser/Thr kinase [Microbacterium sp. RU33B]|uniref:Stk1 family PASTA domain-containing Ser/Thr kinase n=1 Tax=Microbacterium sp. RU33B TaxID=1907390 RepID=UPI000969A554|nr:Stk1 family PASTA domain-containing Ser/Thr kinase [Microbacterium sp. RU33B]SIT76869.1 serine/threonine protein kinase [Microbacterium sp. RU33B]
MSTSQQADPLIGRLVDGRYRVRARIARGGMATVYVATDLRLERRVALKVMHGHLSDDTVFQSRFIQEARAAARLADPHVVNVFDQGQDGDMAYLVMEYLPGITLRELLREQKRLTIAQTITIMDAVMSGLAAAHRAGIVHRDVKPENVLLAEDGRIKIGDFGLARATTANTASGAQLLGTIAYLAPELVTRGTADARSDIYALGIMLYEMLVGEQPYKGEQPMQIAFQHATDSVPRPSVKNPGVPEAFDELVLWSTEKNPDDRPVDATEMLKRLREIERELGVTPQVARAVPVGVPFGETSDSGELTKVLPATITGPLAAVDETDNATRLRQAGRRRAAKGGWLFALVVILALVAGGAGWWFGSGPGSMVAVPDVANMTYDEAVLVLQERSLVAAREDVFDFDIPAGTTVGSDPGAGDRVDQDSTVTVRVSKGPQDHTIPALLGMSLDEARTTLEAVRVSVPDDPQRYFTDAAENSVIAVSITPRAGGEPGNCTNGCVLFEGDTAGLSISVGPVPAVAGLTADEATAALSAKELTVASVEEEFSDDVESGRVIRIADRAEGGNWRPGESMTLIVSKGPQPIEVPDVRGEGLGDAMRELREAGFNPQTTVPELLWGFFSVASTDPAPGSLQLPGTNIRVRANEL